MRYPISLDFSAQLRSMLIYAANARGKSSLADAVEWFFTGSIEELRKEGCTRLDYRHRLLDSSEDAIAELEFDKGSLNSSFVLSATGSQDYSNTSTEFNDYLDASKDELLILRHKDLKKFVDATKSKKRQEIAELIGMQGWEDIRADIGFVANRLAKELEAKRTRKQDREKEVAALIGADFSEEAAWKYAEGQASNLEIEARVNSVETLRSANEKAKAAAGETDRSLGLSKLAAADKLLQNYIRNPPSIDSLRAYSEAFVEFCKDPKDVLWQKLSQLLQLGTEVLQGGNWTEETCPLCGLHVTTDEIMAHIRQHQKGNEAVQERVDNLEAAKANAKQGITEFEDVVREIASIQIESIEPLRKPTSDVSLSLTRARGLLREDIGTDKTLDLVDADFEENLRNLARAVSEASKAVATRLADMGPSETEKKRIEAYQSLANLVTHLDAIERLKVEIAPLDVQATSMSALEAAFEQFRRQTMGSILDAISTDVSTFYLRLHPNEGFDEVRLKFLPDEDGVEFHISYKGEEISPPRKFLSESYQSGLGVCLFLATVKAFNRRNAFILLDDVINSFDIEHRSALADLLVAEFSDYQLIVLTHDEVWFELLRRMTGPGWGFRRIVGWSYEGGLDIEQAPTTDMAECTLALQSGDVFRAAPRVRMYLERRLKRTAYRLGVRTRFRQGQRNEARMAGELLSDIRMYLDRKGFFDLVDRGVFRELEASAFVVNYGSHDQSVKSSGLSIGDIQFAFYRMRGLEDLFMCGDCGTSLWRTVSPDFQMQCKCGHLHV